MSGSAPSSSPVTMICVHGAGGGGWEWAIWQRMATARGLEVLAPDLRPSKAGIVATRFEDYREQVRDWCRAARAPCVLVGARLGGLLALAEAGQAHALVLVNPLPPAGIDGLPARKPYDDLVSWRHERGIEATRRALSDADPASVLWAFRRWRDESGAVLNAARAGIEVPVPQCPLLVMAGAQDTNVPPTVSLSLAQRYGGEFEMLSNTGQLGPLLGYAAAHAAGHALDWLERLDGPGRT